MNNCLNEYCSFNSYKGLLYKEWFDSYSKGIILPPVEVNLDIVNNCQLYCVWCNGKNIIERKKEMIMDREHLLNLCKFFRDWGVKAVCFAGGGESVLHPELGTALEVLNSYGLETALITNGLFLNEKQIEQVARYCRWIGISVDASDQIIYERCKGQDKFKTIIGNIKKLISYGAKEVTYKYLIHPFNQNYILNAAEFAKSIGCNAIHFRPINPKYLGKLKLNKKMVDSLIQESLKLHCDTFKVWNMFHKSNNDFTEKIHFNKCIVSPLLAMFEANGDVNVCIDRKGEKDLILCQHFDTNKVLESWGSQKHKDILNSINPSKDCPKCTLTIYQELYEALQKDSFCWRFP